LTCNNYDGIIIVKNIQNRFFNQLRNKFKKKILYDFDDAIWLKNKLRINEFASTYYGRKEGLSKLRFIDLFKAFFCLFEITIRYYIRGFQKKSSS
jgi:hypothetical protein